MHTFGWLNSLRRTSGYHEMTGLSKFKIWCTQVGRTLV